MFEVEIKLLGECNFRCLHCYADATVFKGDIKYATLYSPNYISNFMQKLREFLLVLNAEYLKQQPLYLIVSLMGGEPLLIGIDRFRMMIDAVLNTFTRDNSGYFVLEKITTSSNGMLFDRYWISFFKENADFISISLAYDFGPVRFANQQVEYRWKEVYRMLKAEGLDVSVNVVLTRYVPEPEAFVGFLKDNDINSIDLSPFLLVGRGRHFADSLKLRCSEISAYYVKLCEILRNDSDSIRFDTFTNLPFHLKRFRERLNVEVHLNGWGPCWNKIIVDLEGNVFLECTYPLALCNIFDPLAVFRMYSSSIFTDILKRKLYREQCVSCEFYNFCRGGCVALTECEDIECRGFKKLLEYISENYISEEQFNFSERRQQNKCLEK